MAQAKLLEEQTICLETNPALRNSLNLDCRMTGVRLLLLQNIFIDFRESNIWPLKNDQY